MEEHGLQHVAYRGSDEFCPFGPKELCEDIFRKEITPAADATLGETNSSDPRYKASTYAAYLSSIGQVPDWILDWERYWEEMRAQRMTDKSRRLLEKAQSEGRMLDVQGSFISRSTKDLESRQERQKLRESQKIEDQLVDVHKQQALSREEASTKVQSFFNRLQQDIAQREASQKEAGKSARPAGARRRKRSRKRASKSGASRESRSSSKPRADKHIGREKSRT